MNKFTGNHRKDDGLSFVYSLDSKNNDGFQSTQRKGYICSEIAEPKNDRNKTTKKGI